MHALAIGSPHNMKHPQPSHTTHLALKRKILPLVAATTTLLIASIGLAWYAYGQIGKTPGELMDYAERRLQGHNKLEWVALPIMGVVRDVLDQPSRRTLLKTPFAVPRLPPLALQGRDAARNTDPAETRRVLRVGPYEELRTIASAARVAKDDDIVEIQAGEYYGDVAIWRQKKLTIRARGGKARLHAAGKSAQHKAIWVLQNGDFHIENIEFIGTHVYDKNGAGIRFEGGTLLVKNCLFYANDTGLLTTDSADSLVIENSEFAYNGYGDGFSHNLYVGKMRSLKITGSYFHHVNVGHGIKSRAQNNHIYYNRITDESGGRASYEVDLPNGGIAYLVGNIIQQDVVPQNSAIITFGSEGMTWPENRLYLASNTLVNDHPYGGTFVRSAPGTQSLVSVNNLWVGPGKVFDGQPNVQTQNDIRTDWSAFVQASRHDYRLGTKAQAWSYAMPVLPELLPAGEYLAPLQVKPLAQKPTRPGALQTP